MDYPLLTTDILHTMMTGGLFLRTTMSPLAQELCPMPLMRAAAGRKGGAHVNASASGLETLTGAGSCSAAATAP